MATNTTNYNLNKPEDTDNADLKLFVGSNMDIIDVELAKRIIRDIATGKIKVEDLPIATADALGAVKVGSGLSIDANGLLTATGGSGGTTTTANSFLAYQTASQNFSAGAWTKIQFQGMKTHIGGGFDLATYDYVVPESGTYLIGGAVSWQSQLDGNRTVLAYYKNGYSDGWIADISAGKAGQGMAGGDTIVSLNAGDRLSLYAYTVGAVYTPIVSGNALTYFFGIKL
jgi:hypothetical protein